MPKFWGSVLLIDKLSASHIRAGAWRLRNVSGNECS